MPHIRIYGPNYPVVYDKWQVDGATWMIQDLPPEDDNEAIRLLVDYLCPDETLCQLSGTWVTNAGTQHKVIMAAYLRPKVDAIQTGLAPYYVARVGCVVTFYDRPTPAAEVKLIKDPESVRGISDIWRYYLKKRTSLGCYIEEGGVKKLIALNVCLIICEGEHDDVEIVGEKWKNVYKVIELVEAKADAFKYLGMDKLLYALGLVVKREYRGANLGARVLAARRGLALSQGVRGTSTIFTGIASQKLAYKCGFECIASSPIKEFAEMGMDYPKDDERLIKLMVKKFE